MCQPSTVKNLDFVASKFGDFLPTFQAKYKREFGFANPGRDIINDGGRVGGIRLSGVEDHALVTSSGKPDCKAEMTKKGDVTREGKAEAYWQGIGRHATLYIFTQVSVISWIKFLEAIFITDNLPE
ncbi:uncharacterized protein LOC143458762 [Clavelina lepadiformis]|uniref:uncharacterized protein LOC143458762 n=1 Tax=Clavelina lepadiformis TaxID=159417 RepID=UPI004041B5A8